MNAAFRYWSISRALWLLPYCGTGPSPGQETEPRCSWAASQLEPWRDPPVAAYAAV